jgi:large subunit ribosomal protein L28
MIVILHNPFKKEKVMSRVCQVTGAEVGFGRSVSHSHRRTSRRFDVNIQKKRYWVPSLGRHVTLRLSARGIKTIDVRGIDAVVADIHAKGGVL